MNILVVTPIYPRKDSPNGSTATKVVHYFVKEWDKLGHKVIVIHAPNRILYFTYFLPKNLRDKLKSKTGNEFPDKTILRKGEFPYDGITIYRRPIFKLIPRTFSNSFFVQKGAAEIIKYLSYKNFKPDLIVGHWETPVIQLTNLLSDYYRSRKSIVFHGNSYAEKYPVKMKKLLENYDAIGARSKTSAQILQKTLDLDGIPFVCYSGIPDTYISSYAPNYAKFQRPIRNFIYVGTLIARKHCDSLIRALSNQTNYDWHLDIVGDGADKYKLMTLITELQIENNVSFHGRVARERVIELMQHAQCFVMNSTGEVFGLVYLEAMLANCITVASLNEGMDGIIRNGYNGFLVNADSTDELADLLKKIQSLDCENAIRLAQNGYATACKYTNSSVAKRYLASIDSWRK